ncbi:MAG: hypothetical protein NTW86_23010 [Candidatus Sumerlaeota bacterium]|nr:hypothetical protein [Candidatus Sumerlaeota bacterium]
MNSVRKSLKRIALCEALAALLVAHAAFAVTVESVWRLDRVTSAEAVAGESCAFIAEVSAPGGASVPVQVRMTCDRDAALKDTAIPVVAGPNQRTAEFHYRFPPGAQGAWRFTFQVLEDGRPGQETVKTVVVSPAAGLSPISAPEPSPVPGLSPMATVPPSPPSGFPPAFAPSPTPRLSMISTPAPFALRETSALLARPDLAAEFLGGPRTIAGAPGEVRALRYRIENRGDAPSSDTVIRYGSNLDSKTDRLSQPFVPGMKIAGMLTFELEPGMTEFWVEAKSEAQSDSNGLNDRAKRPVVIGPASPYEVSVADFSLVGDPRLIRPGDWLEARVELTNPGPPIVDKPFDVALEGLEEQPLRQTVEPPFAPDETREVTFHGRVHDDGTGLLTLTAIADGEDALQERDESDNFAKLDLSDRLQRPTAAAPAAPSPVASASLFAAPLPTPGASDLPNLAIVSARMDEIEKGRWRVEATISNTGKARSPAAALSFDYVDPSLPPAQRDVQVKADTPALDPGAGTIIARTVEFNGPGAPAVTATVNPLPAEFEEATRTDNSVLIQPDAGGAPAGPPPSTPTPMLTPTAAPTPAPEETPSGSPIGPVRIE